MDLPLPLRLWFYLFSQCLFWHFEKLFWDASRCRHEILSVTWFMTAPPTTPPPSALTVYNPKTALFCLYRLKFKLWTSGVEGEGTICKVLIPCWELISNFTFNQVFYSLSSTAASSSFCCYWNYLWPPLRAWQRTPFGICKAELSKYPGKATNIFPTGCNIFSRLVVVFWLLLRSIFICHVALTAACCHSPCLPPTPVSQAACLPACCFCGSSLELWLSSSSSSSPFMRANICALLRIFPSILLVSVLFCHFCLPAWVALLLSLSLSLPSLLLFLFALLLSDAQRNEPKWKCLNERLIGFWWISTTHTHTH